MNPTVPSASRREFLKNTGRIAAASALASVAIPHVHAAESNTIQLALIGCGSRGTGAAGDAMSVANGPIKLVAMADIFKDRLDDSFGRLKGQYSGQLDVPEDRKFVGFDAYKKAIDCLKPGDVAIFATPLAFRGVDFAYAIEKGVNVFMEKPLTADGPSSRRMFELADKSVAKNLKVGVGLMVRHSRPFQELAGRIHGGEIGDVITLRGYRMHGPVGSFFSGPKPKDENELAWQIRRFHSFLWTSGGAYSDGNIHIIDGCCWMKNAWPIKAQATGGRDFRGDCVDQNFDNYSVEYTFADGAKLFFYGRYIPGCFNEFGSYAHGTKGMAIISKANDCGAPSSTYRGQLPKRSHRIWESKGDTNEVNPYRNEWVDLIGAIRADKPYNEAKRGIEASLVTSMGRMAAHTGREITYEEILNCPHEFAPNVDKLSFDGPSPLVAGADGKYAVPQPGIVTQQEY